MKMRLPECAHCGNKQSVALYWSTRNLMKIRLKTYYCKGCARNIVPKQDPIGTDIYPGEVE